MTVLYFTPLVGAFCAICAAFTIGPNPTYDPYATGTVRILGTPIGKYVDDMQPDECQAVTAERQAGWPLVIAGQAPYTTVSCPGAIMAYEWYAVGCDYGDLRRPPRAEAYILQWRFAWRGCDPPSARQRVRLLSLVERMRPLFVFWY